MSQRAQALADRLQQGAQALASFVESLSDAEWRTKVPKDGREVGVIAHHVASVYPIEIQLAQKMAAGKPIAGVTWDGIAEMNATHAGEHTGVGKAETLELLRRNSQVAADAVRAFSDEQLDTAVSLSLNGDAPLTAQFLLEDHAVRHSFHHLAVIRKALGR